MAPARLLTLSTERPPEPGHYRHEGFEPLFTLDVPAGWSAVQDVPGFFDLGRVSVRSTSSPSSSLCRQT